MKKIIALMLLMFATSSLSQAKEFAYKCSGQMPAPNGHMIDITIAGIIDSHIMAYGMIKSVNALKVNKEGLLELRESDFVTSSMRRLSDITGSTDISLRLPDASFYDLGHDKTGGLFAYEADIVIAKLNGAIIYNPYAKNKISCEGTIEKKSKDGFKDFWNSLGEDYSKFMTQTLWPKFRILK